MSETVDHVLTTLLACLLLSGSVLAEEPLNFSRDVRPILSAKCFACHGPDQDNPSDYRLDTRGGAFADLGGYFGVVPGKPEQSQLVKRIFSTDADELMPPPEHKHPLSAFEKQTLKRWVAEGAPYAGHWAFQAVERPDLPKAESGAEHPVDRFILHRLQKDGLKPSSPAPAATLLRRLHLDLTGLPPTPEQLDAFLERPDRAATEAVVDALMATPAFAERMTLEWLDVARFADTNGYSIDDHRDMWAWRDWVIQAFQDNKPYDAFIHEQLAGDLMENASTEQRIATGFLRNSMNTHEGGTIAEEYRVAYIADKIDTVSTAFMGLTMRCAQCHDHKYDPIPARDYYRFFAFFNTSNEGGNGAKNGNTNPKIAVDPLLQDTASYRESLERRIHSLELMKARSSELFGDAQAAWERKLLGDPQEAEKQTFAKPPPKQLERLSWIWSNKQGTGKHAWFRKTFWVGDNIDKAVLFVSCDNEADLFLNGRALGKNPDWRTPSVFDLKPLLKPGTNIVAVAARDWGDGEKAALLAMIQMSDDKRSFFIPTDETWKVAKKKHAGWIRLENNKGFVPASLVAPHGSGPWGDVISKKSGKAANAALVAAVKKSAVERSPDEQQRVIAAFAKANSDMGKLVKSIDGEIGILRAQHKSGKTSVMVMNSAAADRKTPILDRGEYNKPGEFVEAGIPTLFGGELEGKADRLALANWLTDPAHPLTARVTVNRYWQLLFGTGLVKTTEDFGSQGEWPSHPELLDWLAAEFVASGWDVRALLKLMLMSDTYRQSSVVRAGPMRVDPDNRLLARAPRYRLPAEVVRDSALSVSGLLNRELGGPSVYPPQPVGLWKEVSHFGYPGFFSAQHFFPDRDAQVYRRSLYTFWKRTSPPPIMTTFDAPNRETCNVRRFLTNTPLQALVLMNAPQSLEAARGLAGRMRVAGPEIDKQIDVGFRLATSRHPSSAEAAIFRKAYQRQLKYFRDDEQRTSGFLGAADVTGQKSTTADKEVDDAALAALQSVASLILNLDETITRE